MTSWLRRIFLPFLLLLAMLIVDGVAANVLQVMLHHVSYLVVPAFCLITFIILAIYTESDNLYYMALIIGFLYDAYYAGILGINLFIFPVFIYLARYIFQRLPRNFFSVWLMTLLLYLSYQLLIFAIYRLLNFQADQFAHYLLTYLFPSVLFNALIIFILHWSLEKFASWIQS
ncbi:hypothetical protein AWM75_07110 [Aerococcus urinaehominis]|uniref:Uncharacterized protein n=1 Tax=Aerococcus urinaehominis TaxID=128944 RepID=A0A120IB13_9LACT|nr:rod shape-determining protein MreD [Aerococcus urinaehominis]AMB99745.1 hypothetical protein AWM75_07110 [Aerococcus urinaehominis]SDM10553.1 rod shape-determining protein MreD [Aerococcus urinaehominis]